MATSFGALCTDFYVNQKIALKMDLPHERETILHFFDRVRADQPAMSRFKRYTDELALESRRREGAYQWLALRQNSLRTGQVNPDTLEEVDNLHRQVLRLAPYHLSLSPIDVDYQEVMFGFDLECRANHHEAVAEALFGDSPLAALLDVPGSHPTDVQPLVGISLSPRCDVQAVFEVKGLTGTSQIRSGKYRPEPISILLTVRRFGPIEHVDDLPKQYDLLRGHAERLAEEKVVPELITPISRAISHTP